MDCLRVLRVGDSPYFDYKHTVVCNNVVITGVAWHFHPCDKRAHISMHITVPTTFRKLAHTCCETGSQG